MKVSTLIITYNEADNLSRCLAALSWCDDIVVVDSGSTDDTVRIAQRHNARVLRRQFDDFASQRNFGLTESKFCNDWVLHLDADEVVTPEFVSQLLDLEPVSGLDAYFVPCKIMLFGRWLRFTGMYPVYQVRLGRIDRLRFKQAGHGQREDLPSDRIGFFDEPYLHFAFSHGFQRWLEKHVVYAAAEAKALVSARQMAVLGFGDLFFADRVQRRRAAKNLAVWTPLFLRPLFRFFYVYLIRRGFFDGAAGFCYAFMLAVYEANISILAYELLKPNDSSRIA